MGRKFTLAALTATLAIAATTAGAATLNFKAESAGNERGVVNGYVLNSVNTGGINVTLSATYDGKATGAFAYFDDGAALGVCHKGLNRSKQCKDASDDNVTRKETLTLGFDSLMTLSGLSFMAEGHTDLFSDTLTLLFGVNGGALTSYTFNQLRAASFDNVSTATFGFGGTKPDQYYLKGAIAVAAVPLPASLPLFAFALGGLGFASRRRSKCVA
jgi:hypothetical protein